MPQKDRNRVLIEPAPGGPKGGVIDPHDPQAARRFEIQQRGGRYSDRIKRTPEQYWKHASHPALNKV